MTCNMRKVRTTKTSGNLTKISEYIGHFTIFPIFSDFLYNIGILFLGICDNYENFRYFQSLEGRI